MAIVINAHPGDFFSAQGDIIFVVYEATKANDPVTYPNYKYLADIYIGSTQVARIKKVPQPDNKRGVFDVGDIIRNYIATTFNPFPNATRAQEIALNEFFINATIKFGEEYSFTEFLNVTVDDERTYFNHYNGRMYGELTILSDYSDKGASSRPAATSVYRGNVNNFIPYFTSTADPIAIEINTYNENNVLLNSSPDSITPSIPFAMQVFNFGIGNLNAMSPGFIGSNVKYFTVQIGDDSLYRFDIVCEPRYEVFNVHFLNKLGGFESREFTKISRKTLAITKTDFGKLPYSIDASGNVSYFNSNKVYNETKSTYASQYTEKLTLNTDILTDAEYIWLAELILSPMIYVEQNGYYLPAAITQQNYIFNKQINDKLTNLTIDFDFGDQFNAQYR